MGMTSTSFKSVQSLGTVLGWEIFASTHSFTATHTFSLAFKQNSWQINSYTCILFRPYHWLSGKLMASHKYIIYIRIRIRCENNKLRTYSTIKDAFALEPYLTQSPLSMRRDIIRLRISCHPLAIEIGRYSKPKIPVENHLCELCNMKCVEDEYHMLLVCPFYSNERALMFDEINQHTQLSNIPSPPTFKTILSLGAVNSVFIPHVGSFISTCFECYCQSFHKCVSSCVLF